MPRPRVPKRALLGGGAWATLQRAEGTIHGCYLQAKGILRVV